MLTDVKNSGITDTFFPICEPLKGCPRRPKQYGRGPLTLCVLSLTRSATYQSKNATDTHKKIVPRPAVKRILIP